MPRPTKRQQQVKNLSRKRGRFVPQELPSEVTADTSEEAFGPEWEEEELREFEVVEKRFINKALHWNKGAVSSLRSVYVGTSKTTIWQQKIERIKEAELLKGTRNLDTFFQLITAPTASTAPTTSTASTASTTPSVEVTANLHRRLEEADRQCSITKSSKVNG